MSSERKARVDDGKLASMKEVTQEVADQRIRHAQEAW
jgi:hypothetical protein